MDLLDLMASEDELKIKALARLAEIIALYDADQDDVQDEALARAISLCGKEWGSYRAGVEHLAQHREHVAGKGGDDSLEIFRLREEAEEPGTIIRTVRSLRARADILEGERAVIAARYGGVEAALAPSPVEKMFIDAARGLSNESEDPWAPLEDWIVPWHPVPDRLAVVVGTVCPLPDSIGDARAEALSWEQRRHEREVLSEGPGSAALPTACAARHHLVEDLWRQVLPVQDAADLEARLDYWASRGGDDGSGYACMLTDLRRLMADNGLSAPMVGTREKARRLRQANPEWSLARIGKELGISRQAVHKHLRSDRM